MIEVVFSWASKTTLADFQSVALPTELSSHSPRKKGGASYASPHPVSSTFGMNTRLGQTVGQAGLIFFEIVVEFAALAGLGDVAGADDEVTESLAVVALFRIALEDRAQDADDFLLLGRHFVQLV